MVIISRQAFGISILIDPGHGGDDEGAIGTYTTKQKGKTITHKVFEKEITLALSKKIYRHLKKKYPTYLTRSFDRTITLGERAELAEKLKVDLFISVHANADSSSRAKGFETYYLDNSNDGAVKKVEEVENASAVGEALVINQILADLVIQKTAPQSKLLSKYIHNRLKRNVKGSYHMHDRGIKGGLFYVLALSKRPAVLLEAGFMTNPKELQLLMNSKFQERYAKAVVEAVDLYVKKHKKKTLPLF